MTDASQGLYDSINSHSDLLQLITDGASEDVRLECKAPITPRLDRSMKVKLGNSVSGFANTDGGVIIWGMSTTPHSSTNSDTLTQIAPLGQARTFLNSVQNEIPRLTMPVVSTAVSKLIKERTPDTRGVVVTHIPVTSSDPVQCNNDGVFYMRVADGFQKMPYSILQRMFASPQSPDLYPEIDTRLITKDQNGKWNVAISFENLSSKSASDVAVIISVMNPDSMTDVRAARIRNVSDINPGTTTFNGTFDSPIHRGLPLKLDNLSFTMRGRNRIVELSIGVFADQMRARYFGARIDLVSGGVNVDISDPRFVY